MLVTHDPVVGAQAQRHDPDARRRRSSRRRHRGSPTGDADRWRRCSCSWRSRSRSLVVLIGGRRCCAGWRPATRFGRPVEAVLVIAGSLLGTAIITGSLIVGDTINRSIRAAAYDQLGPVDEIVSVPLADGADARRSASTGSRRPSIDGVLPTHLDARPQWSSPGGRGGTQPRAQLLEVDFAAARGSAATARRPGISGRDPDSGSRRGHHRPRRQARHPAGRDGSRLRRGRHTSRSTVDRVLPRRGVAGFWTIDASPAVVQRVRRPGTIAALAASGGTGSATEPPQAVVAFSNTGGVEAGAAQTAAAVTAVDATAGGARRLGARPVKQRPARPRRTRRASR